MMRRPASAVPPPVPRRVVPALLRWFAAHARDLPWRRTREPYAVWVSEIMLQQTQVRTVIPYWERWMRELPDVAALAAAPAQQLHQLWEGLGYYTRVRNLQRAARHIVAAHGGRFPSRLEDILALPGVGRYTAGAVASIAFNQPAPILDGNVIRVLTRLHGITADPRERATNERLWSLAEELVAAAARVKTNAAAAIAPPCSALNQALMELGALICTPRAPQCAVCPVARVCAARATGCVAVIPRPKTRPVVTARRFVVVILERRGRVLVRQRAAGGVNAQLWEFPNVEAAPGEPAADVVRRAFGITARLAPVRVVNHAITRFRIRAEAYRVAWGEPGAGDRSVAATRGSGVRIEGTWRTRAELRKLPLTAAHRKIAGALGPAA